MDQRDVIDVLIAFAFGVGGWIMNNLWMAVKDLQAADTKMAEKVSELEVFVATKYLSTDRFEVVMASQVKAIEKLGDKLDRLSEKIDTKMDKP